MMNSLGITGNEQLLFGFYLIAHGLIHLIFMFNFFDEKTGVSTGWSGKSWLFDKFLNSKYTKIIGLVVWITIAGTFTLSGLIIFDFLVFDELLSLLIIIGSMIAVIAFIIFFDGLSPTPYHWILGIFIDLVFIAFIVFFPENILEIGVILVLIWAYGMVLHTKILTAMGLHQNKTTLV